MPRNKTLTHEKIIKVAKQEFLNLGYQNVSMRDLAAKIGMSQAGLYRHYDSKAEMFDDLVNPLIDEIKLIFKNHEEKLYSQFDDCDDYTELFKSKMIEITKKLMSEYKDELKMILCSSKGTKYENFVHEVVMMEQAETLKALEYLKGKGVKINEVNPDELHILLSAYISAICEPIIHDWPLEKAIHSLNLIEKFFIPGWKNIMFIE